MRVTFTPHPWVLVALLIPLIAHAEEEGPLVGSPPVLRAKLLHAERLEIAPTVGFTIGDTYEEHVIPGLSLSYFPLEWLGVGLDLKYGVGFDSKLKKHINEELSSKRSSVCPPETLNALGEDKLEQCLDELGVDDAIDTRSIESLSVASLQLVPIRGKAKFLDSVLRYDVHILTGIGFATLRGSGGLDGETSFAPVAGIGSRWFVNDWVTLLFQARDVLLKYRPATNQNGSELPAQYFNHFEMVMGVGFVFPQVPGRSTP